jgi:hypothetical protein
MRIGTIGLLTVVIAVAGCKTTPKGSDRTSAQVSADNSTAKSVKKALEESPVFKFPDVNANVYKGNVQLTGFVATEEQRTQAAQTAAGVKGVNQVINNIMIKPTPTGRATIRDPLGRETGAVLLNTNAPPPSPMQVPPPQEGTQPPPPGTQPAPGGTSNP